MKRLNQQRKRIHALENEVARLSAARSIGAGCKITSYRNGHYTVTTKNVTVWGTPGIESGIFIPAKNICATIDKNGEAVIKYHTGPSQKEFVVSGNLQGDYGWYDASKGAIKPLKCDGSTIESWFHDDVWAIRGHLHIGDEANLELYNNNVVVYSDRDICVVLYDKFAEVKAGAGVIKYGGERPEAIPDEEAHEVFRPIC